MKTIKAVFNFLNRNAIAILVVLIAITSLFLFWIKKEDTGVFASKPKYHFYFIAQNSVDPFWREVRLGIEDAARKYKVAVEYNMPRFNNPQEELKYLDIAVISNVDGIITHVSPGSGFRNTINEAYKRSIPVVTIENDDNGSNRNTFVGTNSFMLGKQAAELMIKATGGKANIAVIGSNDSEPDTASQNLKMTGFLSTIKGYPEMKLVKFYNSKMGVLSAEDITQTIISSQEDINAIYTTNSVDTLGSAQIIVDRNKVGVISLVGYGDTESILRYIEKGVIYGTVMSDPYKMGYESLTALIDIKQKQSASTFIDTGVKVINRDNLSEYRKKLVK